MLHCSSSSGSIPKLQNDSCFEKASLARLGLAVIWLGLAWLSSKTGTGNHKNTYLTVDCLRSARKHAAMQTSAFLVILPDKSATSQSRALDLAAVFELCTQRSSKNTLSSLDVTPRGAPILRSNQQSKMYELI